LAADNSLNVMATVAAMLLSKYRRVATGNSKWQSN
jgi:hypothetical protein